MVENPVWSDPEYDRARTIVGSLPIRGEKRLVPVVTDVFGNPTDIPSEGSGVKPNFEAITMAKDTLTDYITISIPSRESVNPNDAFFTYRFLINPKTLSISRQTLDAQSMTRGGWQFGIWGEDTTDLHFSGTTAGQYFEHGLTDRWQEWLLV
jgi:hypothetical protein